jgi:hypothetical protein
MTTFLVALLVFIVAFAAMAVGLLGKRRLRGTCGVAAKQCDCTGRSACTGDRNRPPDRGDSP